MKKEKYYELKKYLLKNGESFYKKHGEFKVLKSNNSQNEWLILDSWNGYISYIRSDKKPERDTFHGVDVEFSKFIASNVYDFVCNVDTGYLDLMLLKFKPNEISR